MKEASEWRIPKLPFFVSGSVLLVVAAVLAIRPAHAITQTEIILATVSVALGAVLACLPYVLEYRAIKKLIEVNAVGTVAEKFSGLERLAAQVADATNQWAMVQEATKGGAEKTIAAAREIAERMANEVREFNEFQAKMSDSEKAALRLEVDKLRRVEGEWLQVVARILDHVYALHNAAARSGQPELTAQIANFQHACRDSARRVGLVPFEPEAGEAFDAQKHRVHGEEKPADDAVIGETLAPGILFQGRLLRPALVHLQAPATAEPSLAPEVQAEKTVAQPESDQLTLEAD